MMHTESANILPIQNAQVVGGVAKSRAMAEYRDEGMAILGIRCNREQPLSDTLTRIHQRFSTG